MAFKACFFEFFSFSINARHHKTPHTVLTHSELNKRFHLLGNCFLYQFFGAGSHLLGILTAFDKQSYANNSTPCGKTQVL